MEGFGFPTETSTAQWELELTARSIYSRAVSAGRADPADAESPGDWETSVAVLQREEHVAYLLKSLRRLSAGFVVLDASRCWLCYWIVHSLTLPGEALPGDAAVRIHATLWRRVFRRGGVADGFALVADELEVEVWDAGPVVVSGLEPSTYHTFRVVVSHDDGRGGRREGLPSAVCATRPAAPVDVRIVNPTPTSLTFVVSLRHPGPPPSPPPSLGSGVARPWLRGPALRSRRSRGGRSSPPGGPGPGSRRTG